LKQLIGSNSLAAASAAANSQSLLAKLLESSLLADFLAAKYWQQLIGRSYLQQPVFAATAYSSLLGAENWKQLTESMQLDGSSLLSYYYWQQHTYLQQFIKSSLGNLLKAALAIIKSSFLAAAYYKKLISNNLSAATLRCLVTAAYWQPISSCLSTAWRQLRLQGQAEQAKLADCLSIKFQHLTVLAIGTVE
jgi:hypothetical protein